MSVRDEQLIRPVWPFALNHQSQQAQGLVAWWPMAHPGGARLFDLVAGRYHGTVVNNPKWSLSPVGPALDLVSASTQYASTTLNTAFTDFTCVAWFYGRAGATFARIVDKDFTNGFWLGRANSGTGSFGGGVKDTGSPFGRYVTLPEHQWNHIVSRRAGTTHSIIGNGGTVSTSGTVTGAALGTQNVHIGANTIGGSPFDGMIGEVRMYDRGLSDAEVWALYDPATRYELYYPLGRRLWFIPAGVAQALAGSSAGVSTAAGALSVARPLAGTSAGVSTAAGAVAVARSLAGASAGVSTSTGALTRALALAGTSAGQSTASGALIRALALSGASAGVSAATAALTVGTTTPEQAPRYTKTRTPNIVYIALRTANMAVLNQRITSLVAGDTWPFYMTYNISTSGIAFSKIYLTIKNDPTDADGSALVQKSITTSATTSGQITDATTTGGSIAFNIYVAKAESVLLTPGEDYYYDFQGIGSDGAVYTFETGIITPAQGVTAASS